MKSIFTVLIFALSQILFSQSEILRQPALSPDGQKIAFSWQGDIWTANIEGEQARRLTIHQAYESGVKWSPNGKQLAFVSDRHGNDDIFVMNADGSNVKQVTFHSHGDTHPSWTDEGELLFTTSRNFVEAEWDSEIHTVSSSGGTPQRKLDALGNLATTSPNGRYIAFVKGSAPARREAYRGPANLNIWIFDQKKKSYHQLTQSPAMDLYPRWGDDENLYFMSAQSGHYNIHSIKINNEMFSEPHSSQHTDYQETGIRYFSVGNGGKSFVYSHGADIYAMDIGGFEGKKINVKLPQDERFDPEEQKTFSSNASEFNISPNGKYLAFTIRGEIFISQNNKDKKRTVRLTDNPARDQSPRWINDTSLIFLSDRNGQKDIYFIQSRDEKESNLFKSLKHSIRQVTETTEDESGLQLSPNGKLLTYLRDESTLVVSEIDSLGNLSNEKTILDGWASPQGVRWSPDSRWLAYAKKDLDFNAEIFIQPIDGSHAAVNMSLHPRGDHSPFWSADGSKLGFVSNRNHGNDDIWFVWLKREDWEKSKADWEEDDENEGEKKDAKKDSTEKETQIEIDLEDIQMRLAQVTRMSGNERSVKISKDGKTFFFVGEGAIKQINWDGKDMKDLVAKGSRPRHLVLNNDGKMYFLKGGGNIAKVSLKGGKSEALPFDARMKIDYKAERKQIFEEAWRELDKGFYDPNFHGKDWNKLKTQYEPLCMATSTRQDFRFLFNEMLGQLNASHSGMYGPDRNKLQKVKTGLLGVELSRNKKGLEVTKIVSHSPADHKKSKLEIGDILLSVNGESLQDVSTNLYALLNHQVNEKVLLEVENNKKEKREVVIRPTASLRNQAYEAWVKERKHLTEKYSGGRLGYIHIRAMGWRSFERFERELTASGYGKEGIVIDVRFNGGGWTTDMLLTILNVRQHAYTIPRGAVKDLDKEHKDFKSHYPYGERLPFSGWTRPSIALCNESSYSNAEIFSHAFKNLGLGKLVGMPTFGAVISTGSRGLIDGGSVRMPFRAWYVSKTEKNMELGPAVPDIIIQNPPDSKAKGQDPQLRKAVEVLLKDL